MIVTSLLAAPERRLTSLRAAGAGRALRPLAAGLLVLALATGPGGVAHAAATAEALSAQAAAAASWPHTIEHDGASVTVYQPQAVSWPERKRLTARAALSITRAGQAKPLLGTIEVNLATTTDAATGVVSPLGRAAGRLRTSRRSTPSTPREAETKIRAVLAQMQIRKVPLASILLSLNQLPVETVKVNNDPPVIFYAAKPASLVVFDGEPVLVPAGKSTLTYAVNTNWQVFNDSGHLVPAEQRHLVLRCADRRSRLRRRPGFPTAFMALKKEAAFAAVARYIPAKAPPPKEPGRRDLRQPEACGDHRYRRARRVCGRSPVPACSGS